MRFPRTRFTLWFIAITAGALLLKGCAGSRVTLDFPLSEGNSWVYRGKIATSAAGQEQEMPPLTFRLEAHQHSPKPDSPFTLFFYQDDLPLWSTELLSTPKGLENSARHEIWIPRATRMGHRWSLTLEDEKIKMALREKTTTTVPAGTFPAYLIDFKGREKHRGSLWLNPEVGVISAIWVLRSGSLQTTTQIELLTYHLPSP